MVLMCYRLMNDWPWHASRPWLLLGSLPCAQHRLMGPCPCRRFPSRKEENWWLIVGQPELNLCHIIKRQPLKQSAVNKLRFKAPSEPGQHELKLMFISDSYVGADQVGFTDHTSSAGTTQQPNHVAG